MMQTVYNKRLLQHRDEASHLPNKCVRCYDNLSSLSWVLRRTGLVTLILCKMTACTSIGKKMGFWPETPRAYLLSVLSLLQLGDYQQNNIGFFKLNRYKWTILVLSLGTSMQMLSHVRRKCQSPPTAGNGKVTTFFSINILFSMLNNKQNLKIF